MSDVPSRQPDDLPEWAPRLAETLREQLPSLADEVVEAVAAGVPAYARPLQGSFGEGVRRGVEEALGQFVSELEQLSGDTRTPSGPSTGRLTSLALGRGELRAGRPLDALLSAYRVGARVSWRRMADAASGLGLDGDALVRLGELIYSHIDRLSAASVEGYALEQSIVVGERDRLRGRLADMVVAGAEPSALDVAAAEAGWVAPPLVNVIAVASGDAGALAARLADHVLLPPVGEQPSLLVVAGVDGPPGRAAVRTRARSTQLVVGPRVPWHEAHRSAARASTALALVEAGVVHASGPVWADDHLADLVLHADPATAADLAAHRLAPLDDLDEPARERLAATLQAWLLLEGARAAVAERLHVHPQTVRYRLAQLRGLYGDALDDPEVRFEISLALRLRRGRVG